MARWRGGEVRRRLGLGLGLRLLLGLGPGLGLEGEVVGAQRLCGVDVQVHEYVLARDGVRSVEVEALEEEVQLVVQGRLG